MINDAKLSSQVSKRNGIFILSSLVDLSRIALVVMDFSNLPRPRVNPSNVFHLLKDSR